MKFREQRSTTEVKLLIDLVKRTNIITDIDNERLGDTHIIQWKRGNL